MKNAARLFALLLVAVLALGLSVAPGLSQENQPPADQQKKKEEKKKKATKVWTNDDFPSHPEAAEEKPAEAAPAEAKKSLAELFAELDQAKADKVTQEGTISGYNIELNGLYDKLDHADNDYDRQMYQRAVAAAQGEVDKAQEQLKEINARIAELEKLTKGKQRPAPKPAAKPAEGQQPADEQPPSPPPSL